MKTQEKNASAQEKRMRLQTCKDNIREGKETINNANRFLLAKVKQENKEVMRSISGKR